MPGAKAPTRQTIALQMQAVPLRNHRISASVDAGGVSLVQTLEYGWWLGLAQRLLRLPLRRTYRLEGIACEVWTMLDDRSSIGALVETFAQRHQLSYHESRAMLMTYFRTLVNRGVIAIVGFETARPDDDLMV